MTSSNSAAVAQLVSESPGKLSKMQYPPRRCSNPFKLNIRGHRFKPLRWHQNQWLCSCCRSRLRENRLPNLNNPTQNDSLKEEYPCSPIPTTHPHCNNTETLSSSSIVTDLMASCPIER
jgi:hypothetical protein